MTANYSPPGSAQPEDLPGILDLVNSVFSPERRSMERDFPALFHRENAENLQIITDGKNPVAHIGILIGEFSFYGLPVRLGSIGSVCTAEDHRGRGLATRLLEHSIGFLRRRGVPLMLVSGGRDLYRRKGCTDFGVLEAFAIDGLERSPSGRADAIRVERVRKCDRRLVSFLLECYQREPVRFLRVRDHVREILERYIGRSGLLLSPELFLVYRGDEPAGYVILVRRGEGDEGERGFEVLEYAGDRDCLVRALGRLRVRVGEGAGLYWPVPDHDRGTLLRLRERGFTAERWHVPRHTLRVVDFEGLMDALEPYFRERIGGRFSFHRDARGFVIRHERGERRERGLREDRMRVCRLESLEGLQRFLFGAGAGSEACRDGPGGDEGLAGELREVLPLPPILPGVNYI